ncbi:hypothetical protein [Streptococcus sanguinis]|uniref:hypothetical protein n=1 Tax=Streptococcus sanguinis TaxID=1305 RepID=UPI000F677622|nr:hypothetical protein [Streptococcus sanguinis]RSJ40834.1 hypothetical protein D8820_04830 [Streptococcus sanguinis]
MRNTTNKQDDFKLTTWPVRLFTAFIFFFPIIVKMVRYFAYYGLIIPSEPWKLALNVVVENFSFYSSALTISFTVFVFVSNERNRYRDDRKEREKERERNVKEKEKELEQYKDHYRPSFVVDATKGIILIMREDTLYIENVKYYDSSDNTKNCISKVSLKSGDVVSKKIPRSFYITATTIIGEEILFGYLNGGIKIYKYLKSKGNALYPGIGNYSDISSSKDWGDYNNISVPTDSTLSEIFFYNTYEIREKIFLNTNKMKGIIDSRNFNELLNSLFELLSYEIEANTVELSSVYSVLQDVLDIVKYNTDCFDEIKKFDFRLEYILNKESYIINNSPTEIGYFDSLDDINTFFMMDFIDYMRRNLSVLRDEKNIDDSTEKFVLRAIIAILLEVFDKTNIPSLGNIPFIVLKANIFNNIHLKK